MIDKKTRNCKVTIFGDSYTLLTTEAEEHINRACQLVDASMQEVAAKSTHVDEKKVAVLAALRIASKLLLIEDEVDKGRRKEKQLVEAIEHELNADSVATI